MNIEMRGIFKSFDSNHVLKDISFPISGGQITALLGENGAGKSTLMNILGGVLPPDQGQILIDGSEVEFNSPADSLHAGIAFIHQELNVINDLPIFENLFLGRETKSSAGFLKMDEMRGQAQALFNRLDLDLDPNTLVRDLDASYKQIVEICKALLMNASIIIMDEPTSSLTNTEIDRVFDIVQTLRQQGVGIVFISHKLQEVIQICDNYVILRDGKLVASGEVKDVSTGDIAALMVGHKIDSGSLLRESVSTNEVLRLEMYSDGHHFNDINLHVYAGEVLGITGLLGDGRSELFLSLIGAGGRASGDVYFNTQKIHIKNTTQALRAKIGYLPRNRKENGIIKDLNILENASIVTYSERSRFGFINNKIHQAKFRKQIDALRIKLEKVIDPINSLSGGNQQKVVLAKWLSSDPQLLILDNPTQGVDVGAKEEIYTIISELAHDGVAIIVLTSEASEVIRVCDRAIVMYHGTIQGEVSGDLMNEKEIMRLATGVAIQ